MGSTRKSDVDLAQRVAKLTAGQRACLDLVDDHATSKEIARELGISRHTVDARLRGAIQILGVTSRREAVVIYRAAMQAEAYQPFAYQSADVVMADDVAEKPAHEIAAPQSVRTFDSSPTGPMPGLAAVRSDFTATAQPVETVSDSAVWTSVSPLEVAPTPQQVQRSSLRLWGGHNDLSPAQRLVGIVVVTILSMLAFGVFLSGIEALILLRS